MHIDTMLDNESVRRHLERTTRSWLGLPVSAPVDVPQLPCRLAARLLRVEEYEQSHRDRWGCWEFSFCASHRRGKLWDPEIDRWVAATRAGLSATTALEPLWPKGREFAVCLTHDVDMVARRATPAQALRSVRAASKSSSALELAQRVTRAAGRAARYGISRRPSIDRTLAEAMAIERDLGVCASYLFALHCESLDALDCVYRATDACAVHGRARTIADVVRMVRDSGFDVGLHGSYRSATNADVLRREKQELEAIVGGPVVSTRQHYLHFEISTTPAVHEQVGLRADSSLGFNRSVGFRAGTSLPFWHFDLRARRSLDVLEIPLIVQESPLLSTAALELDGDTALAIVRSLLDSVASVGGVFTFLIHPHNIANPQFLTIFRGTIEYGLQRGAWFASLRDIDRWWREREAALLGSAQTALAVP